MKSYVVGCSVLLGFLAGCGSQISDPPEGFGPIVPPPAGTAGTTGSSGVTVTTGGFVGPGGTYDQPVVVQRPAPPAISGGTLLVLGDGTRAAVADPERDVVHIVDLDQLALLATIPLRKGDEPGRMVEDKAGLVHVVLRGAASIATLDASRGAEQGRQAVCPNPRGLAYDPQTDALHVACAGGELVTLKSTGGDPTRQLKLDRDLRDVVVDGNRLLVSRFRAAELLIVEASGQISGRLAPPAIAATVDPKTVPPGVPGSQAFSPAVAWRTTAAPGGGAIMVFQQEQSSEVVIQPGGYGGFCGGIVRGAVSLLRADGSSWTQVTTGAVLPVDVAATRDGLEVAVAVAGSSPNSPFAQSVISFTPPTPTVGGNSPTMSREDCFGPPGGPEAGAVPRPDGQVVSVAFDGRGRLVAQTRDPMLIVGNRAMVLPGDLVRDTGHDIFHMGTAGGIACASCHPEGREDGHTWKFAGLGDRRTQSLAGGTLGTGPFHWTGDMKDLPTLAHEVLSTRMSGPELLPAHVEALAGWLDQVPAFKPEIGADQTAVDRGWALFHDPTVACSTCHAGAQLTNRNIVNVGTGNSFKVPSLIGVAFRAPLMHNGCAATLADRFGACGGTNHGQTAGLTDAQRLDLIAYLSTL